VFKLRGTRVIFGAHQSIAGGFHNALTRGREATCDSIQIFNKSNNQWKARPIASEEIDLYLEMIDETGISVACSHTSYLINIASPDPALNKKSYLSLKEEMERCEALKVPNLVMHPGSHVGTGEEQGLNRIGRNINKLFRQLKGSSVTLCLETTAGQGSNLGYSFEQLAYIIDKVEDQDHIGVCLDTCHIFAAGYEIRTEKDYRSTMNTFKDQIGFNKLKVIHINDSKGDFGSRKDRHEHIGEGAIGKTGFQNLVSDRRLAKVPMILETPKEEDLEDDKTNLKVLRSLIRKPATKPK
jgi:deoxyribonuclease-4